MLANMDVELFLKVLRLILECVRLLLTIDKCCGWAWITHEWVIATVAIVAAVVTAGFLVCQVNKRKQPVNGMSTAQYTCLATCRVADVLPESAGFASHQASCGARAADHTSI